MEHSGLISVIVPVYNVERYLLKCLQSIRIQSYRQLEVIVVDDGSTDESAGIARTFCETDPRFRYIRKENGGLSSARNMGLDYASGEYIYFLDSDDSLLPDGMEKLVSGFSGDDLVDVVIGKYVLDDSVLQKQYTPFESEWVDELFEGEHKEQQILCRHLNAYPGEGYLIRDTLMPVWKNLYRRSVLERNKIRFRSERMVGAEDYVFNFDAYYHARKVRVVPHAACVHLIVLNSLSRRYYPNALERVQCRMDSVLRSMETKNFFNRDAVLQALEHEFCRSIIDVVYGVIRSDAQKKYCKIRALLKDPRVVHQVRTVKEPNLTRKYEILWQLLRGMGVLPVFMILTAVKYSGSLYRKMEFVLRK